MCKTSQIQPNIVNTFSDEQFFPPSELPKNRKD